MTFPNISILGSGNLAFHLSKSLEGIGIKLISIYSREIRKAEKLSSFLYNASPTDSLDFSQSSARLFFLCLSDDVLPEIAQKIILPENSLLVHCSGSTSLESISKHSADTGVFYPLQTFTAGRKISFTDIPICIEASTSKAEEILERIAIGMNSRPYFMNSEQRLNLHLSAVISCNFTNHLFSISKSILKEYDMPFNLLHHLIAETVQKAIENEPDRVQTGPAVRSDMKILELHESLLADRPAWMHIYHLLSEDIGKMKR